MVRTRLGIEVHVTHPKDAEDEGTNGGGANDAEDVGMETCGEESKKMGIGQLGMKQRNHTFRLSFWV